MAERTGMRQCGGCTLCCKLIPVEELAKPAGMRCAHCRTGKGCAVYATRPLSCREWSCMWLIGDEGGHPLQLRRPDHVHYVIDTVPDIIRLTNNETGEVLQYDVIQIWCDPKWPMAVEDDAELKAMLDRVGIIALVRFDSSKGYALFPPSRSDDGQWHRRNADRADDLSDAQREARFAFWRGLADSRTGADDLAGVSAPLEPHASVRASISTGGQDEDSALPDQRPAHVRGHQHRA